MPDIAQIDPYQAFLVVAAFFGVVIGFEKLVEAGASLKHRFVDSRQKKLVDAALAGDGSLREEIMAMFGEAHSEHERYDRQFANDKRAIERLEGDMAELKLKALLHDAQIAEHREEGTVLIKSVKTMLKAQLGLNEDTDVIDAVNEIDQYLIERRSSHDQLEGSH